MRHRQYRAIKALSADFSAEIYVPLKDRGGNPNKKGGVHMRRRLLHNSYFYLQHILKENMPCEMNKVYAEL